MNRKLITGWLMITLGLAQVGGGVLLARAAGSGEAELADANLIRIHVIAHSDEAGEQALKLAVRDAVLDRLRPALVGARSRAEAEAAIGAVLHELEEAAGEVVAAWGMAHPVRAELGTFAFPGKGYDGLYLPAGRYRALRILIGDAAGANFWCLVYPSFCYTIREVQAPARAVAAATGPAACAGGCPGTAGNAGTDAAAGRRSEAAAQADPSAGTGGRSGAGAKASAGAADGGHSDAGAQASPSTAVAGRSDAVAEASPKATPGGCPDAAAAGCPATRADGDNASHPVAWHVWPARANRGFDGLLEVGQSPL